MWSSTRVRFGSITFYFVLLKILQCLMFADDNNIFHSGNNLSEITENISSEMVKIKKWFDKKQLYLNWEKTKYMVFGNRKNSN